MSIVTLTFVSRANLLDNISPYKLIPLDLKTAPMAPEMVSTRQVGEEICAAGAGTAAMRPVLLVPQYEPTPEPFSFLWGGGNVGVGAK